MTWNQLDDDAILTDTNQHTDTHRDMIPSSVRLAKRLSDRTNNVEDTKVLVNIGIHAPTKSKFC
jgi:hypothetical protein